MKIFMEKIKKHIKTYLDYPIDGIKYYDLTVYKNPKIRKELVNNCIQLIKDIKYDYIALIEARGFLIGSIISINLKKVLFYVEVKKIDCQENITVKHKLEYGEATMQVQEGSGKVLIFDDVIATGYRKWSIFSFKSWYNPVYALYLVELTKLKLKVIYLTTNIDFYFLKNQSKVFFIKNNPMHYDIHLYILYIKYLFEFTKNCKLFLIYQWDNRIHFTMKNPKGTSIAFCSKSNLHLHKLSCCCKYFWPIRYQIKNTITAHRKTWNIYSIFINIFFLSNVLLTWLPIYNKIDFLSSVFFYLSKDLLYDMDHLIFWHWENIGIVFNFSVSSKNLDPWTIENYYHSSFTGSIKNINKGTALTKYGLKFDN